MTARARHSYLCGMLTAFALSLSGCLPLSTEPAPTATPMPATHTPTFPFPTLIPTATLTPPPSPTPTPDPLSGIGEVIFEDSFERDLGWVLQIFGSGGAGVLDGAYSLSARQVYTQILGYSPADITADAYLQVSARPLLCSPDDEYGLAFRTNPLGEYYRFTLNCQGAARLSRITTEGEFVLFSNIRSDSVFPGLLIDNVLAVRMKGEDFTLYINGSEVARVSDTVLRSGGSGLFIRTRQGGQTTVQFDDFILWSLVANTSATATP